jgi:hypothetical protein
LPKFILKQHGWFIYLEACVSLVAVYEMQWSAVLWEVDKMPVLWAISVHHTYCKVKLSCFQRGMSGFIDAYLYFNEYYQYELKLWFMTGLTPPHVFACTLISIAIYRCHFTYYLIGGVMVNVVDRGFVKPKTIKLEYVASPLSTQHYGERAKTGSLRIRIMCPNGATCFPADCCFSELAL